MSLDWFSLVLIKKCNHSFLAYLVVILSMFQPFRLLPILFRLTICRENIDNIFPETYCWLREAAMILWNKLSMHLPLREAAMILWNKLSMHLPLFRKESSWRTHWLTDPLTDWLTDMLGFKIDVNQSTNPNKC